MADVSRLRERDFYYDIETTSDGRICCLTLVDRDTEDAHFMGMFDVDEAGVAALLRDGEWLAAHTMAKGKVEPLKGDLHVEVCESESRLLAAFARKLGELNVHNVVAWGADFDGEHTDARCKSYGVRDVWQRVTVFDLMSSYSTLAGSDNFRGRSALKYSCLDKLGYGKIETDGGERVSADIDGHIDDDPELLAAYNVWDAVLCRRLNTEMKDIIQFYRTYTDFAACTIEDFQDNIRMVDTLLMFWNYPKKSVLPTKIFVEVADEDGEMHKIVKGYKGRIKGGFVMDPKVGLFECSFELDLTRAYPTTIISGNYSTETYVDDMSTVCRSGARCRESLGPEFKREGCWSCRRFSTDVKHARVPSGRVYRLDSVGCFPELLQKLKDLRSKYQREMDTVEKRIAEHERAGRFAEADALRPVASHLFKQQFTMKSISNAFYGVLASPKFRLTNSEIAADVTHVVRNLVKWNIDTVSRTRTSLCGAEVVAEPVYADTDGTKCAINKAQIEAALGRSLAQADVKSIGAFYRDTLNESYKLFSQEAFGNPDADFEVKLERCYQSLYIWGAKKMYIYKEFPEGDRPSKVVKVGIKRSDRNRVFVGFTDEVGNIILNGVTAGIGDIIQRYETDIMGGRRDRDLGRPEGVTSENNSFWDYMAYSNTAFGKDFKQGDKPVFYRVKGVRGRATAPPFVALEWGDDPGEYGLILDREWYVESLRKSVEAFLAPIGTWDVLKSGLGKRGKASALW